MNRVEQIEQKLVDNYSHLLGFEEVARVLGITVRAARVSDQRGTFALEMKKIPGRRGKVVPARVVAEYLASLEG